MLRAEDAAGGDRGADGAADAGFVPRAEGAAWGDWGADGAESLDIMPRM